MTFLDAFEGRRMLIAYYSVWHTGHPAPEQCEGCTWVTSQVREPSYIHSRDVTFAVFCQGPDEESQGGSSLACAGTIIQAGNVVTFESMECLANPLVPPPLHNSKPASVNNFGTCIDCGGEACDSAVTGMNYQLGRSL